MCVREDENIGKQLHPPPARKQMVLLIEEEEIIIKIRCIVLGKINF